MGEVIGQLVPGGHTVALSVAGGVIVDVRPVSARDAEGTWIAPGLVDIQVNGSAGIDLNDDKITAERVGELVEHHWRAGVTALCATIVSAPEQEMVHRVAVIASARRADARIATAIPALHIEGPHLSSEEGARGAHAPEYLRPPDLDEFARLQKAADGAIGIVTLAPELPGALEYIRVLTLQGVVVALGHTAASPIAIVRAVDAGARLSTHLGNGATATLPRHPNHLWEQLADDRLMASFIADGHHLPPATLTAMLRAKGVGRSILISDSTAFAGMTPGTYESHIGRRVELTNDRRLSIVGTPYFAGSAVGLLECVAGAVRHGGVTLAQAIRMASTNPSVLLGRPGGVIRVGAPANIFVFTYDAAAARLQPRTTLLADGVAGSRVP